ncbi:YlbF family regulator [Macrococcus brunensis]|uniref:YlbF family regulator n=2 Tax=Macrococcus brunensis TaxID=198483 RepID=A0A4R6BG05_9STAP|nr:YlbF family regulator [Macrococcus brunensis]TDL98794.1 YlbF family regulator [Macrococcus brunensis]ULG75027.1 YlbF family regulator [Macrococcus brunensis]
MLSAIERIKWGMMMIYDDQLFNLLDQADELNSMILESECFKQYRQHQLALQQHAEVSAMRKNLLKLKERYDEVMRFGRYHPDYMETLLTTRRAKKEYDLHPVVAEAKKSEMALQTLLDEILIIISRSVSDEVKVESGNPFFTTEHSCSGGCSCSA